MPAKTLQKLLSSKLVIVLFVLVLLVFGFVLFGPNQSPVKKSGSFGTPLADAYNYMYSSDGVVATTTDITGKPSTVIEVDPPDMVKTTQDVGDKKIESIRTGYDLYLQDPDGKWRKITLQNTTDPGNLQSFPPKSELANISAKEKDKSKFSQDKDQNCPETKSTCSVYKEKMADNQVKVYYVEKSSGKLLRDQFYFGDNIATVTKYEYRPVDIALPTDISIETPPAAQTQGNTPKDLPEDVKKSIEEAQKKISPPANR